MPRKCVIVCGGRLSNIMFSMAEDGVQQSLDDGTPSQVIQIDSNAIPRVSIGEKQRLRREQCGGGGQCA